MPKEKEKNLDDKLDKFLGDTEENQECECTGEECLIKTNQDGLVERVQKKYVTEDGRQLLI